MAKVTSTVDRPAVELVHLKEYIKELKAGLGAPARGQAEMAQVRMETHAVYTTSKVELGQSLNGCRPGSDYLRERYGNTHDAAGALLHQKVRPEIWGKRRTGVGAKGELALGQVRLGRKANWRWGLC